MTKEAFPAVSVYMLGTNNWPRLLEQDFLCGHGPDDLGAGRGSHVVRSRMKTEGSHPSPEQS